VAELYRRDLLRFLKTGRLASRLSLPITAPPLLRFVPLSILLRYYNTANELCARWQRLADAAGVFPSSAWCDALLLREAGRLPFLSALPC
jgi:hypothetical protein